jgi:hypothetical protein
LRRGRPRQLKLRWTVAPQRLKCWPCLSDVVARNQKQKPRPRILPLEPEDCSDPLPRCRRLPFENRLSRCRYIYQMQQQWMPFLRFSRVRRCLRPEMGRIHRNDCQTPKHRFADASEPAILDGVHLPDFENRLIIQKQFRNARSNLPVFGYEVSQNGKACAST